jgi:hypothetical protein
MRRLAVGQRGEEKSCKWPLLAIATTYQAAYIPGSTAEFTDLPQWSLSLGNWDKRERPKIRHC